jgi:hypothetical protein
VIDSVQDILLARSAPIMAQKILDPVASRLIRLRESLGYETSAAFASFLGTSAQRWNNLENGLPLSKDMAFTLVRKIPGLTLDWLYFEKADGLPLELARRLGALGEPGKGTTASRKPSEAR